MTHYDGMREAHANANAERHKAENRIVTAPCGCSWTLPMGQVQSRCAEHQKPSQPSQPAFDAEAARGRFVGLMQCLATGGILPYTIDTLLALYDAALDHIATQAALIERLEERTWTRPNVELEAAIVIQQAAEIERLTDENKLLRSAPEQATWIGAAGAELKRQLTNPGNCR